MKLDVIESQDAHPSTDQGLSFELAASLLRGFGARAKIQRQAGFFQSKTIGLLRGLTNDGTLKREGGLRSTQCTLVVCNKVLPLSCFLYLLLNCIF